MLTFNFVILSTLLSGVLAGPVNLAKRVTEGVHLVNCGTYSAVVYCVDDGACNFVPTAANECKPSTGIEVWEGGVKQCTFSTGTTFSWSIQANAQAQANFSLVGTATNGFHPFVIYKDDQRTMFTDSAGKKCQSVYYCLNGVPPVVSSTTTSLPTTIIISSTSVIPTGTPISTITSTSIRSTIVISSSSVIPTGSPISTISATNLPATSTRTTIVVSSVSVIPTGTPISIITNPTVSSTSVIPTGTPISIITNPTAGSSTATKPATTLLSSVISTR